MSKPNILLITVDDLNWNSVGAYGCPVPDITPHIDRLAASGMRFNFGHVTSAVCMPSRHVLATGLYPHNNGVEGFRGECLKPDVRSIMEILSENNYRTGILGKKAHSSAGYDERWDFAYDMKDLDRGRSPELYGKYCKDFFESCNDQAFYFMVNSHDPHRPFYGSEQEAEHFDTPTPSPSRVYRNDEVNMPGFLPALPEVRLEMSEYYSSVRRCDDTLGAILHALEASPYADNTLIFFLSDNGMAFPFAKTNCYLHSTKTPWIMKLPGGNTGVNNEHFVSGIDWFATVADYCQIDVPSTDGRSLLPLLRGETQADRDYVFTQFNETAARNVYPMRCVQDQRFGYIYNAWSDGTCCFKNESQSGRTWKAMQAAAEHDPAIAERVQLFSYRVPEELYDFENDPDALNNLINDPDYQDVAQRLRTALQENLKLTNDWVNLEL